MNILFNEFGFFFLLIEYLQTYFLSYLIWFNFLQYMCCLEVFYKQIFALFFFMMAFYVYVLRLSKFLVIGQINLMALFLFLD